MGYLAHVVEYASRGSRFVICAVYFNLIDQFGAFERSGCAIDDVFVFFGCFPFDGRERFGRNFSPFRSNDSVPVVVFPYFDGILAELKSDAEWLE